MAISSLVDQLYPLYLKLEDRRVLVVGGGRVARRRIEGLLDAGALVLVVSPEVLPEIEEAHVEGRLEWRARRFIPEDLDGVALGFLAVGDPELVKEVRSEADRRGILLNTAEQETTCDFHVPAVVAVKGVRVAISTSGASPALAGELGRRLERWLSTVDERTLDELRARRKAVRAVQSRREERRAPGLSQPLEPRAREEPEARRPESPGGGKRIALVGGGPGDAGLLTVRARRLLEDADVVYYDRLVSREIYDVIPDRVEKVYVGKEVGCANRANIARLMIDAARAGRRVVRLKGGDPVLFGRGGEEMLALKTAGLDFELVPGVSALCSVPGAAGIPLTYRGVASELVVRSGHRWRGPNSSDSIEKEAPWGRDETTFVYFMAVGQISRVVDEVVSEGLPLSTPVAIIEKGTLPDERVVVGDLGDIAETARRETIEPPALIVIGDVVKFRRPDEFLSLLAGPEARGRPESAEPSRTATGHPRKAELADSLSAQAGNTAAG